MARNLLVKDIGIVPAIPGLPGQPLVPARCTVTSQVTVCGANTPYSYPPGTRFAVGNSLYTSPVPGSIAVFPNGSHAPVQGFGAAFVCLPKDITTCYPGQPYIAPVAGTPTRYDYNLGWNAGARSVGVFDRDGYISFKPNGSVSGVFVGLTGVLTYGYVNLPFAWYVTQGVARVYENGVLKHNYGVYVGAPVFTIRRLNGTIAYLVDGIVQYTSLVPSFGMVFMDVVMYAGGDEIYDPVISGLSFSEGSFLPMAGVGGETGSESSFSTASFAPLTGFSTYFSGSAASFAPLKGHGTNHIFDDIQDMAFQPMTGSGTGAGFFIPGIAISTTSFLPLVQSAGRGMTGTNGRTFDYYSPAPISLHPLIGLGWDYSGGGTAYTPASDDNPDGEGSSFLPMYGGGSAYEGNERGTLLAILDVETLLTSDHTLFVVMNSEIGVVTTLVASRQVLATMISMMTAHPTMTVAQIFAVLMLTSVNVGTQFPTTGDTSIWVVNVDTQGVSRYESYDFNSYGKLGANYFGMAPDGLHQLDGIDDTGTPIDAMISLGKRNFGTTMLKRMANAYVGISSSGSMFLKIFVAGQEYVYRIRNNDPNLKMQRFDLGKGLRANYFELELYNQGGADFELDTVEFQAAVLERRI